MTLYISPQEIIQLFLSNDGRVTNHQLVRHFGAWLGGEAERGLVNKEILKRVTHHVARKERGARETDGGKVLLLKERFREKSVEDIWSSLTLTLTQDDLNEILPIVVLEDETDQDMIVEKVDVGDGSYSPVSHLSLTDKTKSVRDLTKNFNNLAQTSSVSLTDHLSEKNRRERSSAEITAKKRLSCGGERFLPLTQEARAWLKAAMRSDFQTLARLARTNPELVVTREPSSGYTALHWAAKLGSLELVKLMAGTYMMDPDVRTRGGYTPLMLAALGKKHEVYDLLVNAYKADESLRDFSGRTSGQYLEVHYPTLPGITSRVELSHDTVSPQLGEDQLDTAKKRRHVARAATNQFISEFRESIRDIRGSFRDNWLRHKSLLDIEK